MRPRIMRGQNIDGPGREGDRGPRPGDARVGRADHRLRARRGRRRSEVRSFAADVLMVFGDDDKLWCETIAARLAGSIPAAYADITKDAVASQLRALEVDVKSRPRDRQGTAVGLRAGRRRRGRAAARSVAEAPGCVVLPQHALTWPDTAAPLQPLHR